MATSTASRRTTPDDCELARLAVAGDGDAFAELYDRHERRVFGFCLRMLRSEDEAAEATQETFMRLLRRLPALNGRELNFAAYALAAARNACYDAIESRRRVEPVGEQLERLEPSGSEPGELALDPERAALLAATRDQVRAANAALPARQREVLALRELEQLSYEQIGEIVGLNGNAVAQLISRARIRLRDLLRGGALESLAASSPDCERALPTLARLQDAQGSSGEELDWVQAHVAGCETCRLSRAAMEEAGLSYRALGPIVALAWLRHTTIARAADLVGADWSHLTAAAHRTGSSPTHLAAAPHAGSSPTRPTVARRVRWALALTVLCAIVAVPLAGSIAPDGRVLSLGASTVSNAAGSAARRIGRSDAHVLTTVHRGKARERGRIAPSSGSPTAAAALAVAGSGAQPSTPAPASHRDARHRASRHTSTRHPTPHASAPASTPPSGAPTTTAPPASPPSGESGTSTGSGSGTSTSGSGTTSTPAEAPPPGGSGPSGTTTTGPTETGGHSCVLAIAC